MGGIHSKIQFPVGILERMRQCSGRHTESNYHSFWMGSCASCPGWRNHRWFPESRRRWPHCDWRWPTEREREVQITAGWVLVEIHVTDWATAQNKDPKLDAVLQWLESKKKTDLGTLLGEHTSSEEGWVVWRNHQNFTTLRGTLYLSSTPKVKNEDLLLFVVLKMYWTATLNGCHQDAGHQGHDHTLSLLQNDSGGQEWPNRWDELLGPVNTASRMRVAPQGLFMPYSGYCSPGSLPC